MSVFSFGFLAFLCAVVLAFHAARSTWARQAVLSAANAVFLTTFVSSWAALAGLAFVTLGGYLALLVVRRRPGPALVAVATVVAVVILLVAKRYVFLAWLLPTWLLRQPLGIIGLSYMTFKFIHVLVDLAQDQLAELDLVTYLNYQLGFVSLVAGPIQRYNDFAAWWRAPAGAPDAAAALRAWRRVLLGMLKVGVLGALAFHLDDVARDRLAGPPDGWRTAGWLAVMFYGYPAYVYFNFAGYCDAVIGAAAVLGLRHQENFDRPWRARNLLDFWNRWHISLTLWIRDYLFTPLYRTLATRWPAGARALGYGALFVALLAAGIWHGPHWNFVAFGLVHAVGVTAVRIYGDALKARFGRAGLQRYVAHPLATAAATVATFHYVCLSFVTFAPGLRDTLALLRRAGEGLFQP